MAIQAQLYSANLAFPSPSCCGSQEWVDFYGKESYFNPQQMEHVSALKSNASVNDNFILQSIVEKQRQEIDRFISLHNERLELILQEQRKQELARLVQKIEAKTLAILKQKDEEIAKAANRTMELEIFLRKLEMENQAWQRVANENEAMVISLNNTIEQLKENNPCCGFFNNAAEDAESCCEETEKNRVTCFAIGEEQRTRMLCKSCNSRNSCVLFLPCRHLCSCQTCESFLESCPVCNMVKKASIETQIF